MKYNTFLFSMLVKDELMIPNNLSLPYDQLKEVLDKHYEIFASNDTDFEISAYEAIENYLNTSGSLLAELYALDEEYSGGYTHVCPQCQSKFNYNDSSSTHQVNDNNGLTYCSYECSAVATLEAIRNCTEDEEIIEIIENT